MILLWLGCSQGDPELRAQRRALDAWEEGVAALPGDPLAAREAFARAQEARPDDVLLQAWEAEARAASGDLQGATDALETVLRRAPRFAEARYNRAAYLARSGQLEAAGPELALALEHGARRSREAMVDPDFAPHLQHPAFAFLPDDLLMVAVDAPREAVFWGSEATVRLRVVGAMGAPVHLHADALSGPVTLTHAVEDVVESTEGPVRDLLWTFKVEGAGEVVLGPLSVQSGGWTKELPAIRFATTAPPGREPPLGSLPLDLPVPTDVCADLVPPAVRRTDGTVDVLSLPQDRVSVDAPGPPVRYELRDRSQPVWVLLRFREASTVTVRRGAEVVLSDP